VLLEEVPVLDIVVGVMSEDGVELTGVTPDFLADNHAERRSKHNKVRINVITYHILLFP
jgi:hypothetical protein